MYRSAEYRTIITIENKSITDHWDKQLLQYYNNIRAHRQSYQTSNFCGKLVNLSMYNITTMYNVLM